MSDHFLAPWPIPKKFSGFLFKHIVLLDITIPKIMSTLITPRMDSYEGTWVYMYLAKQKNYSLDIFLAV